MAGASSAEKRTTALKSKHVDDPPKPRVAGARAIGHTPLRGL